jgi:hypothetical protein
MDRQGLDPDALARLLRTRAPTVGRWLDGESHPQSRWHPALAQALKVDAAELEAGLSDDEEVTAGVLRLLSDTPRNPEGTVQVVQDPRSAHPEVRFNEVLMAGLERHDFENSIWCRIVDHLASQIGIKDWRPIAESNN